MALTIFGVPGLPEIADGADLATLIAGAAAASGEPLADGDVVVVTSKIVSKAEGRTVALDSVTPSPFARRFAEEWEKDPAVVELALRESRRVVRQVGPVLITETRHGFVCANSGVDQSSSGAAGRAVLLPEDPDASARRLRARFRELGADAAVIVSDTFGRPWREGQTNVAIGLAGMRPLRPLAGERDLDGRELRISMPCPADEIAAAAGLAMAKASAIPAAIVRGYPYEPGEGSAREIARPAERDLFP